MRDAVADQYEAYPYPARKAADEANRLITGSPSHILEIDHYVFGGRRDFRAPFRALVAGGGTGDGLIMLAAQLAERNCPAEIVYLDLSSASRKIAEARAAAHGFNFIRFETGAIEDIATGNFGLFDYIDCCGVLHHLDDPAAGLEALKACLASDGGIGLMVYAPFGRSGVYEMQNAIRTLADGEPLAEQLVLGKRLVRELPATNRFKRNPFVADHLEQGDAGFVDLLLHPSDRAYSVADLAALAAAADMHITGWIEPARYDPERLISSPKLARRLDGLDIAARAGLAEQLSGNIRKHIVYMVRGENSAGGPPPMDDLSAIPVLREMDGPAAAKDTRPGGTLSVTYDGLKFSYPLPKLAPAILGRIDGAATLDEIFTGLAAVDGKLDHARFLAEFGQLFAAFNGVNRMYLRFGL